MSLEQSDLDQSDAGGTRPTTGRTRGFGRVLIVVYGILAIAATARSGYQIAGHFADAPLAYSLSAVAGAVYIVATVALIARGRGWFTVAVVAIVFELVGVLVVGILSFAVPALFDHPSVWSWFGAGYGCIPLVLPFVGLWWLWRHRPSASVADAVAASA